MTTKEPLLITLRRPQTPPALFRKTTAALSLLLAQEALDLKPTILVPILRSGISLLPAFSSAFPEASIGILGIKRNEKNAEANLYYDNLPTLSAKDQILILDPMLATGGTSRLAIATIIEKGATPGNLTFISIIASVEGSSSVKKAYPEVTIRILATDPELSSIKMIIPGLGDFGDRFFDTQKTHNT